MTTTTMPAPRRLLRAEEPEWLVWLMVLGMLLVGLLVRSTVQQRAEPFNGAGVMLGYPGAWSAQPREGYALYASDPLAGPVAPPSLSVREVPLSELGRNLTNLSEVALAWNARQARELDNFRALSSTPHEVDGQAAIRSEYAYVVSPAGATLPPVVLRAEDLLLLRGETLLIITFAAESGAWGEAFNIWEDIFPAIQVR